jgi:magnesium chelatase family protein
MIQRYISKISGPLMDRIDNHIDGPAVNCKEMRSTNEPESSAKIRERVMRARQKQLERFASSRENSIAMPRCRLATFAASANFRPIVSVCSSAP